MKTNCIAMLFLVACLSKGFSQRIERISVAATSEAIGLPFTNYLPYHPGVEVKGTLKDTEKARSYRFVNVNLGFFYHERVETAFYLGGEYQYSIMLFKKQMGLDVPIGLGYLHAFYPGELYEQNADGDFEKVRQFGRPRAYANLGVGVSYTGASRFQPYIRQELMIETPFANGIPVIPHSLLKLGVCIKLGTNETE